VFVALKEHKVNLGEIRTWYETGFLIARISFTQCLKTGLHDQHLRFSDTGFPVKKNLKEFLYL
jgi:hypothetical protein